LVFRRSSSKLSGLISGIKDGSAFHLQLKDRVSAGKVLALALKTVVKRKKEEKLVVLGIPRGGVVVADVVAEKLNADFFDVVIPLKLRAPDNKENAIGAIAQDGSTIYLDEFMVSSLKVSAEYIENEKSVQTKEIKRRIAMYRGEAVGAAAAAAAPSLYSTSSQPPQQKGYEDAYPIISAKSIILLIDDGIATGATVIAAAMWLRFNYQPAKLIIAAPVASKQALEMIKKEKIADTVETVLTPSNFVSVSHFYKDFQQLTDDDNQVIDILAKWQGMMGSKRKRRA
jgi:putative phosphoribosyl transferase